VELGAAQYVENLTGLSRRLLDAATAYS
jgi:hypothetical protein